MGQTAAAQRCAPDFEVLTSTGFATLDRLDLDRGLLVPVGRHLCATCGQALNDAQVVDCDYKSFDVMYPLTLAISGLQDVSFLAFVCTSITAVSL